MSGFIPGQVTDAESACIIMTPPISTTSSLIQSDRSSISSGGSDQILRESRLSQFDIEKMFLTENLSRRSDGSILTAFGLSVGAKLLWLVMYNINCIFYRINSQIYLRKWMQLLGIVSLVVQLMIMLTANNSTEHAIN